MTYRTFELLMSPVRLARYQTATGCNNIKTMKLYRANVRLSGAILAVLGMFEVVLRNKIDGHYRTQFPIMAGGTGWLLDATMPGGFLTQPGCHNSIIKINQAYNDLGRHYTHDRLIATLSFGFWKYMFKGNQFRAGGNTLLAIFPKKPPHTNQSAIFTVLDKINDLRNRVAHHEPICFGPVNTISTDYARMHFKMIIDILQWMDINAQQLLIGVDGVLKECNFIDSI